MTESMSLIPVDVILPSGMAIPLVCKAVNFQAILDTADDIGRIDGINPKSQLPMRFYLSGIAAIAVATPAEATPLFAPRSSLVVPGRRN